MVFVNVRILCIHCISTLLIYRKIVMKIDISYFISLLLKIILWKKRFLILSVLYLEFLIYSQLLNDWFCPNIVVIWKGCSLDFQDMRLWQIFLRCSCSLLLTKLPLFWSCVSSFFSVLQTNSSWSIFACHQSFEQPVYVDLLWSQKSTQAKIVLEITMKRSWKGFVGTIVYL